MAIADVVGRLRRGRPRRVPPPSRPDGADFDGPIPIGTARRTLSHARGTRCSSCSTSSPVKKILDVGSGSGWTTALLAWLVGPSGSVFGVELEPDLAAWGAENLGRQDAAWASIRPADPDVLGIPSEAPFDRVLVSATARKLPDELVGQLTDRRSHGRARRRHDDPGAAHRAGPWRRRHHDPRLVQLRAAALRG